MCLFSCSCVAAAAHPQAPDTTELQEAMQYGKETLTNYIQTYQSRLKYANMLKTAAYGLGYGSNNIIVNIATREEKNANEKIAYYQHYLDLILQEEARWEQKMQEYPEATTVWLYLKDLGYSDYVAAGILGNMMAECGGGTFNLKVDIISSCGGYYGICQWSRGYCAGVWYKDLNGQLDYLRDTIQKEFKTFGSLYTRGFTYSKFLDLEDCREVALAFAKIYERCASKHYAIRQDYAIKAYNYFVCS